MTRPEPTLPNPNIYIKTGKPVESRLSSPSEGLATGKKSVLSPVPVPRHDPEMANFIYGEDKATGVGLWLARIAPLGWLTLGFVLGVAAGHWLWR